MSTKTQYVVGLAFDPHWEQVLLIRKQRPEWQAGKLNGPGGHIELGEDEYQAIVREFREETTIDSKPDNWKHFLTMEGEDFSIDVMTSDTLCIHEAQTVTDEEVGPCLVANIVGHSASLCIENIPWMILLAIDHLQDGRPAFTTAHYPPGHRGRAVLGTEASVKDLTIERDNALRQYHEGRKTYEAILPELVETKAKLQKADDLCVDLAEEANILRRQRGEVLIDNASLRAKLAAVEVQHEQLMLEVSILPERLANRLELAMRKGEASSYDELVSLVTEVITHK